MVKALKDKDIFPRIHIEDDGKIHFAVSCRHCTDPMCVRSCIAGAISIVDGVLVCPYGAVEAGPDGAAQKCELCLENSCGAPACAKGCPNNAIVYEER